MPVYIYRAKDIGRSCEYCREGFEIAQRITDKPMSNCPKCDALLAKVYTPFYLGPSKTGFDSKAKEKGFHKLKKVDKGKYEKLY